jgi:hypothetical protein
MLEEEVPEAFVTYLKLPHITDLFPYSNSGKATGTASL